MLPLIALSAVPKPDCEYTAALEFAGAAVRPMHFDTAALHDQLDGAAGVLVSGGADVEARRYGGDAANCETPDPQRDEFEIALLHNARERGLPVLCICRGLQVANVAFGGTLYEDLAEHFGDAVAVGHRQFLVEHTSRRDLIEGHDVIFEADSLAARIFGVPVLQTGSRHHQSVRDAAPGFRVTGRTADGIVEALEATFAWPFFLAVQWHPESTVALDGGMSRRLFAAFVSAAAAQRMPAGAR